MIEDKVSKQQSLFKKTLKNIKTKTLSLILKWAECLIVFLTYHRDRIKSTLALYNKDNINKDNNKSEDNLGFIKEETVNVKIKIK